MIDLRLVRDDPEQVRESQRARGDDPEAVDRLLAADAARREAVSRADALRAESNTASKAIRSASPDERPAMIERAKTLKAQVQEAEAAQAAAEAALSEAHRAVPNVVAGGPAGGEDDYDVLREVGSQADAGRTRGTTSSSGRCSARSTSTAGRRSAAPASTSSPARARCSSSRCSSSR